MNSDKTIGRGPHSPHAGEAGGQSAALLVDFDNVTLGIRSELQQQLNRVQRGFALAAQELIISQDKANTVDLDSSSMLVRVRVYGTYRAGLLVKDSCS